MARPTLKQLAYRLFMAGHDVRVGHYYQHQPTGKVYKVTGLALNEASGEPMALYRPAVANRAPQTVDYGTFERPEDECVFARPVAEFIETIDWHDGELIRQGTRFKPVKKVEKWVSDDG